MKFIKSKNAFTLVELVVTIAISSVVMVIIAVIFPNFMWLFEEHKEVLNFQKKSIVDTSYLFNKISASERFFSLNSGSWLTVRNSFSTYLNSFDKQSLPVFVVSLFDKDWKIFLNSKQQDPRLWIKEIIPYSSYIKIWTYVYFTEPGKHVIKRMSTDGSNMIIVYWQNSVSWYNNTGSWIFNTPTWLAYDWTNLLYVSDSWNNMIRSINISTNVITDVLGKQWITGYNVWETISSWTDATNAKLNYPTWIKYNAWILYFSDTFNNRVRKLNISTQKVYTIVWNDTYGSSDDSTLTWAIFNYPVWLEYFSWWLLVADSSNWKIRFVNETNSTVKTFAWISLPGNKNTYSLDRYLKLDFTTNVQFISWVWIYFNDFKNWILYRLKTWPDSIMWTWDDIVEKILWDFNNSILKNWDFETQIYDYPSSDFKNTSNASLFSNISDENLAPKSGNSYLKVDTNWIYATWTIVFNNNPSDWNTLTVGAITYEFDNNLDYIIWNRIIPIWTTRDETVYNFEVELNQNESINYLKTSSNSFKIVAKSVIGISPSLATISWGNISVNPVWWVLAWGMQYTWTWMQEFYFEKNLIAWNKYELSFYIASWTWVTSTALDPIVKIEFSSWVVENIPSFSNNWSYNRFIFDWVWSLQKIKFQIQNWNIIYFDDINVVSLWTRENDNWLSNFRIDVLPSFFLDTSDNIFVSDFSNKKLKKITISWNNILSLPWEYNFFDVKSFVLNSKEDFFWNSKIDYLKFSETDFISLFSSKIKYDIRNWDNSIKITSNIKNNKK